MERHTYTLGRSTMMTTTMQQTTPTLLVTIRAAAKMLSLGESTVYALVASGNLPYISIGRAKRIAMRDLETWIEQARKRAA